MTENKEHLKQIDITKIVKEMYKYRKLYLYSLPITLVVSAALILCVPRYYTSTVKLAPELSSYNSNSLNDIASSFGFDLGGTMNTGDAIFPELYPDLISSNDFLTSLFDVPVTTKDGTIITTYFDYMNTKQKSAWWNIVRYKVKQLFAKKDIVAVQKNINPFMLTKKQDEIARGIASKIKCTVDKKNYVISITVEDQDALICATMADTIKARLQDFISDYRTSKARNDLEYFVKLCDEAKLKYEKARRTYGSYADANQEVTLESYRLKQNDLENEMQLQYNNYNALATQVQQARAKVQERTPAFTTLQSASVPIKPAGPKRMFFVLGMTFLAFLLTTAYALRGFLFTEE
jgi:uncharacterized protein involved in exopolysaccharide biosynthesis